MHQKLIALVIGNIGTGKSYFINHLNKRPNRKFINNDSYNDWLKFNHDILKGLSDGKNIILEGNYMASCVRRSIIEGLKLHYPELRFVCFDFGKGNEETLTRKANLNPEKSFNEWKTIHTSNYSSYQMPTLNEGYTKVIYKWKKKLIIRNNENNQ